MQRGWPWLALAGCSAPVTGAPEPIEPIATPTGQDEATDPLTEGFAGIQIGQSTGTMCSELDTEPIVDPTAPADGLAYSASDWLAALPTEFAGEIDGDDGPTALEVDVLADSDPVLVLTGGCGPSYLIDATVTLRAEDRFEVAVSVPLRSAGPDGGVWQIDVAVDEVAGDLAVPDFGTLPIDRVVLRHGATIEDGASTGTLGWIGWTEEGDGWLVPVGTWTSTARPTGGKAAGEGR